MYAMKVGFIVEKHLCVIAYYPTGYIINTEKPTIGSDFAGDIASLLELSMKVSPIAG